MTCKHAVNPGSLKARRDLHGSSQYDDSRRFCERRAITLGCHGWNRQMAEAETNNGEWIAFQSAYTLIILWKRLDRSRRNNHEA
jgi:putative AlgH/UPF0301 family transcriptional regulator